MDGLKKRLDEVKGKWVDELPHVPWVYCTTPRKKTGKTPFSMTYGSKVIIPLEIRIPTMRINSFDDNGNE